MPNWAQGIMKVRGTEEHIINFLKGALIPVGFWGEKVSVETTEDEYDLTLQSSSGSFLIKGTRRSFIEGSVEFWKDEEENKRVLVLDTFKQAWAVLPEALVVLSKEYEVDIKIDAFECGMEFQQEVEIVKGQVVSYKEITFDDYQWDCVMPHLGG